MSALAKIKKQAAQLEHDRQYDKALALYTRLLDASPAADDEIDVALYNRAGDVALRAGDTARAVTYYERALDLYAAGGFLNNAIALGAKILRQAPERAATHYTLGVLHAKKGFRSDARQHFLTYAERMQRGGQGPEVARSLADYVVLCDGASDARAGLAAHLSTGGARPADLAARLQELLEQALRAAGLGDDEGGTDGETPRAGGAARHAAAADLVFLDLDAAAIEEAAAAQGAGTSMEMEPLDLLSTAEFEAAEQASALDLPTDADVLHALPGELPPLAPSMVALDGGRDDAWAHGADSPLAIDLDVPVGVPAFADADLTDGEDDVGLDLELMDVEAPAGSDAPAAEPERTWSDAGVDLPLLVDDEPAAFEAVAPEASILELEAADLVAVGTAPVAAPVAAPPAVAPAPDADGIDLGAWLRDSEPAPSTRLIAPTMATTGDEEADFQATLQAFKAGIARSLEDADFDAHYDLGVAYKEMGLLEEAIGEFQKAARAPGRPLRAMEALATCFLERGEPDLVLSTLAPVSGTLSGDGPATAEAPQQVALCYLLGAASQEVGRVDDARTWYLRVLATDYAFRDAATRLASLSPPTR